MERLIFHIDVNSAFLSWEAARSVSQGKEDLRLIPSAIGGDREKRTGVILAKSIPAKKYGIQTGEPVGLALRKCPGLVLVKPDFRLYQQCSSAFVAICKEYAPVVEQVSIDECFLDMTGTHRLYPDPVVIAHTIKDRIFSQLGFTVNIGIGNCKLLAKMASDFEKPDKVHTLFPDELKTKFWPLPVGSLYSVGSSTADKLKAAGIHTIEQLAKADAAQLKRLTGEKMALHLLQYANGIDESEVLSEPEEPKGYSISTTLEDNITSKDAACGVLLSLADSVAARMRADGAKAECIGVTIRSAEFKNKSHQTTLYEPTDLFREIYTVSCKLFDELWDGITPLRLIGISLTHITKDSSSQLTLFSDEAKEKSRRLDKTYDAIHARYGMASIVRCSSLLNPVEVGKKYKAQLESSNTRDRSCSPPDLSKPDSKVK